MRGNEGARCNFPDINKFSVLVDAVSVFQSEINVGTNKQEIVFFVIYLDNNKDKRDAIQFTLSHVKNNKCHTSRKQLSKTKQKKLVSNIVLQSTAIVHLTLTLLLQRTQYDWNFHIAKRKLRVLR